jgi:hypothetical protein
LVKNNILTHNHPSGGCAFSLNDVKHIIEMDGHEIRAVTADGRFVSLSRGNGKWDGRLSGEMAKEGFSDYRLLSKASEIANRKYGKVTNERVTQIAEELVNDWMRANAAKYGAVFTEGSI